MKSSSKTPGRTMRLALAAAALCTLVGGAGSAFAQASSVRTPTAIRLMPAGLSAADVQTQINGTVGSGIPAGFVERRVGFSAGPISLEAFNTAWNIAGWPKVTCAVDAATGAGTCNDGRTPSVVVNEACAGAYNSVVYDVASSTETCTGSPETGITCTGTPATHTYYTCAQPVTYVSYLVKDTSSTTLATTALTSAQIAAYRSGSDGVLSDVASRTAVCQGYGYRGAYNWAEGGFMTCSDNTVARYVSGGWRVEGACLGPWISQLTCAK